LKTGNRKHSAAPQRALPNKLVPLMDRINENPSENHFLKTAVSGWLPFRYCKTCCRLYL